MAGTLGSLTGTLTLDTRFAHLYRPLVRNLILLVVVTISLSAGALIYFDRDLVNGLSVNLIEKSAENAIEKLEDVFEVAGSGLRIAQPQVQLLEIGSPEQEAALFSTLEPFLAEMALLDSINVADESGSEFAMIKQPGELLTRHILADDPKVAHWRRRVGGKIVEQWQRQTDVSPKDRPWYQGARSREAGAQFWTAPYSFLTTKEPGISVSSRWPASGRGGELVVAFNLNLIEISQFTTNLRPSDNGMTVIFTAAGKTVGLPPDPRFLDQDRMLAGVLSPVNELAVAPLDAALRDWEINGKVEGIFPYSDGSQSWWAGFSAMKLDEERTIWSAVLIPELDFLGSVAQRRNLSLAAIGLAALFLATMILARSLRSVRSQMKDAVDQAEQRFGQYQLRQKIGEGGNGSVYRAQHCLLRRPTAIKLMKPDFVRSPACRERFEHEVRITSNLNHPNTIAIYDYGQTPEGTLYYAMELLNGGTLEQLVACSGPMPAARVIHVLTQIAGSLFEAHEKGLIHRDIKPSNAIVCERGGLFDVVKVLDFGLVKQIEANDAGLTQANVLVGTPLYMAPELINGSSGGSPRSDIYALGAAGYYLLTGRNVFEGASAVEICAKHLQETPIPPSQRVDFPVPADLEQVILQCLEKDPDKRPADAESLLDRLNACADAGRWSQQDARGWWQTYQAAFIGGVAPEDATPLANTEMLVDLDDRLDSVSGGTA